MSEQTEVKTGDFLPALKEIKPFTEIEKELAMLRQKNKTVFEYNTPSGNAEARSHVHSMRLVKGRLERKREDAVSEALQFQRSVNADAKSIKAELDDMIEVHAKPLKELEEKEKQRVAFHKSMIQHIVDCGNGFIGGQPYPFGALFRELEEKVIVDSSYDEFQDEAHKAKEDAMKKLQAAYQEACQRQAEQEELAKLRAEKEERERLEQERLAREAAERAEQERLESERKAAELKKEQEAKAEQDRIEREARIAREAEERVQREAEERRQEEQRQREESERRQKQEQADREMRLQEEAAAAQRREEEAKQAALEAEERAAKAEQTARENAQREQQEREQVEREAQEKREANKRHVNKINTAAIDAIVAATGIQRTIAAQIVSMIADGKIPAVSIDY